MAGDVDGIEKRVGEVYGWGESASLGGGALGAVVPEP